MSEPLLLHDKCRQRTEYFRLKHRLPAGSQRVFCPPTNLSLVRYQAVTWKRSTVQEGSQLGNEAGGHVGPGDLGGNGGHDVVVALILWVVLAASLLIEHSNKLVQLQSNHTHRSERAQIPDAVLPAEPCLTSCDDSTSKSWLRSSAEDSTGT